MTWRKQRQRVDFLSVRAQEKRREAWRLGGNLKEWMSRYLGSVETLAWLFAAGSFWAAGRSEAVADGKRRRSFVAVINTSLLAWQLAHRQLEFARPLAGSSSEEQPEK